jgi:hypothetical protein
MKITILKKFYLLILILFASLITFNCDDSGIVKPEETPFSISGKIINWVPFGQKIILANIFSARQFIYTVSYCSIDNEGKFSLYPPESYSDTTKMPVETIFFSGCTGGNAYFNPSDVKGVKIYNFSVKYIDSIIGSVDYDNFSKYDSLKAGYFEVMYVFTNQKVTGTGFMLNGADTIKFEAETVLGWNKIVKHYTRVDSTGKTILFDTNEPAGAVWEYYHN